MNPNLPLSEQFRVVAKEWVQLDGAARMLEEMKTAVLAQMMRKLGDVPVSTAEREVRSSAEWSDYIHKMVEARTAASLARAQQEYIRMKAGEWQSENANKRAEMRL